MKDSVLEDLYFLHAPALVMVEMAEVAVIPIETSPFRMKATTSALSREMTY